MRASLSGLSRRWWLAGPVAVLFPLILRLLTLSRWPIPAPKILDEFSYLYAADTFAEGRLANPTHSLWQFFETVYVISQPATASKYPPAQGLALAAGQALFGDPWYGVWLSCGLMTAAFYWMLLSCAPRLWAFLGALWFGCYTGLLTDWMNSYWGGAVAAAAGAVLLGAYLRLRKRPWDAQGGSVASAAKSASAAVAPAQSAAVAAPAQSASAVAPAQSAAVAVPPAQNAAVAAPAQRASAAVAPARRAAFAAAPALGATFALAWAVLVNARPYEGGLVFGLSMAVLAWRIGLPRRVLAAALATLAWGVGLTMVYNHAVTGDPLKLPYMLHDEQYGHVRPFWFQSMKPQPAYRQPVIANAFRHDEVRYRQLHEWKGWAYRASQWRRTLEFFGPLPVIAPALVGLYALARSRRYRPLAIVLAVGFFCLNLTVFHFAHYAAPFAGLLAMLIVVGWRTLLAGSLLPARPARAALAALAVFAVLSAASALRSSLQPPGTHYLNHFRHVMQQYLDQDIDQHLIFVTHPRELQEIDPTWIYNRANVDEAKVVWAADFGDGENQKLLGYYPARTAWRLDVADRTLTLQPYRAKPGQAALRFIEPGRRFSQKNQE